MMISSFGVAQQRLDSGTLYVQINNIKHETGAIYMAVYDNKEAYMKKRFHEAIFDVPGLGELQTQLNLPYGKFAITIFHDVNDSEDLDTNFMKIPKEPYGFSNNPKSSFGPPGFDAAAFQFEKDGQRIEITLK